MPVVLESFWVPKISVPLPYADPYFLWDHATDQITTAHIIHAEQVRASRCGFTKIEQNDVERNASSSQMNHNQHGYGAIQPMNVHLEAWAKTTPQQIRAALPNVAVKISVQPPTQPRGAYTICTDSERALGQFIVWPDGAVEATVLEVVSGQTTMVRHFRCKTHKSLNAAFSTFFRAFASSHVQHPTFK